MLKEIKKIILEDKNKRNYYEENVLALTDYGYKVKYLDEEILNIGRWDTDTIYFYEVIKQDTDTKLYIGVVDTQGNTESQESEGITEIYEVVPKEVIKTTWEIVE